MLGPNVERQMLTKFHLLRHLETPGNTRLEQRFGIILPADGSEAPLVVRAIAPNHILRDIGVVEILEGDVEPLPAHDSLMLVDNRCDELLHAGIIRRVGPGGGDDTHHDIMLVRLEAHGIGAVGDGLRLDKELGEASGDSF